MDEEGKKKLRLRGNIVISLRPTPWVCGLHKPFLLLRHGTAHDRRYRKIPDDGETFQAGTLPTIT
jgi:hypothetical protein